MGHRGALILPISYRMVAFVEKIQYTDQKACGKKWFVEIQM